MLFKRFVCGIILLVFGLTGVIPPSVYAQNIPNMPANILSLTPAFHPVMIQGMRVHPEHPLQFDFILDTGDAAVNVNGPQFKEETTKLIKYFLASLTVPEKEMWVNLSPYEKNRIIAEGLGTTQLGSDMLAQDYILKQLTSYLIYPEMGSPVRNILSNSSPMGLLQRKSWKKNFPLMGAKSLIG
jgi:hypothetical protein